MTSPNTPSPGQPDPAALLALGLATQAADAGASATPPLTPAELAAEFPQLEILELLGRGGMGAVYKARQRDLDRLVALKILRPGLDADPGFAERFTREARALAQLNHPGIVTLYEFGKTSAGRYFILMEFVDGMNLRQLLAAGRLSPREALAIVPPLCDALQYAHDRGLIHHDIKPENLLIDRLGRIKIADFGIATIASRKPETSLAVEIAGTPAYMAPEQRTHPNAVNHRADLYALGVVLYQMLTGELPADGQLQPPSHHVQLDVRLDEIVLRALEKDPARRYAAANDFKTQLETITSTSGATPVPRSRNVRPLTIALIACVLLAVGMYFISRDSTPVASSAWNLDVIVTDQSTWPPKTFPPDRALPVAGAALALLGASEIRQPGTIEDWKAANAGPHLRLEYPRAAEGKTPDVITLPLPLDTGIIWTRKEDKITRYTKFSHAKFAALNSLLKQPTVALDHSTPIDPSRISEPPRLRAINWLDHQNSPTTPAWLTTGEPVPATEQLPEFSGITDQSNPGARYLGLWFSHPLFDKQSHAKITLLDHTGAPLPPASKSLSWQTQSIPPNTDRAEGWIILTSRLSHLDDTPRNIIASLDYSLGAWTYTKELPVNSHITHTEVLTDGTVIGSPGQNAAGKAFIETSFNPKSVSETEQLDFVAFTQDGRRLDRTSINSNGYDDLLTKRFVFDLPLSQVRAFGMRTRPIRTTEWTIPLQPNALTASLAATKKPSLQLLLEASPVTLPELAAHIRALIARHFPAADINESPDSFNALADIQKFPVYTKHKAGTPPKLAYEETGPSEKGFILTLTRLDQPYKDAIPLPETDEKPHWKTFTNAGFDEARSTGVQVRLMIGANTPKAFHEELSRLIGMLHLPRRSLTTKSGETLSVYTNVFLDENDLSAVEKIPAPSPSSHLRLHLTEQGSFRLSQLSQLAVGRRIAILVNDQLVSAPKVMAELTGDEIDIIGFQSVGDESALLAAFPGPAPKLLTQTTNQAITWLQLVDNARYDQSWQRTASVFRKAMTEDQWLQLAASARTPLGPLISRHLKSTEHLNTLPGAPGGPHIVMQFQARFVQKESAIETVTFTREPDGEWRVSGYFIK